MANNTRDDWQTPTRGKLWDAYQVYVTQALALGWQVKSFDEWLND